MDTKTTLLQQFIKIQNMQFELDKLKNQKAGIVTRIRSLSQKIPQMLRELNLKPLQVLKFLT